MTPPHWLEVGVYVPIWHIIAIVVTAVVLTVVYNIITKGKP